MPLRHEVVYGGLVENNSPAPDTPRALIRIPGAFAGAARSFGITEEMLSKHLLLVGGTGSGKTNMLYHVVQQLKARLTPDDVMLVFDSKGDFHREFVAPGDVVIGNSALYRGSSGKWNLRQEIIADGRDPVTVGQNTQEICKSLFAERVERNSNNPFFPNAARDLLASVIVALIRDGVEFNNLDLRDYLNGSTADDLRALLGKYPDLAAVAAYIAGKSGSQAQGVLSEMYSVTRDILTGVFADVGEFSIREFVRRKGGRSAFLEYDLSIGDVLSPIYTLLFDLALKEALGRTASQGKVYLIADELKLLPNLRHLEDGINFGRGLGVRIVAGLQSIGQLDANYDRAAKARNAVSGFSSVIAFRSNDAATREYVSKLFGRNLILETFAEADGRNHYEKREGYMVEDWDQASLGVGEAIVGLFSVPPFRFTFGLFSKGV